jgi:flagellar hook-associated protein 3 FlgL
MISPAFLSSASLSDDTRRSIARLQAQLVDAQKELATGQHADIGVSLGASTGLTVSMRQDLNQIQSIKGSNTIVLTRLQASQSALETVATNTQSFLSSLIGATQMTSSTTSTVVEQSQAGLQTLQAQLNSSLDGQFLFSGINSDVKPMDDFFASPPSPSAQAVNAAFVAKFGISSTDPGVSAISPSDMQDFLNNEFANLFSGTNWNNNFSAASDKAVSNRITRTELATTSVTANDNTFRNLTEAYAMVSGLGFANLNDGAKQVIVSAARGLTADAIGSLTNIQSFLGVTQQRVTDSNDQIDAQVTFLTKSIDNLENVDSTEVATQLSQLSTALEAAYSVTNRLNNLSLMNYLTTA